MGDLSKDAILAMEARYLPRILTLEVALLTAIHIAQDHLETIEDEDIKAATAKHVSLITAALNDKEYLENVFDKEMKRTLSIPKPI